jgi:hypothetical protein
LGVDDAVDPIPWPVVELCTPSPDVSRIDTRSFGDDAMTTHSQQQQLCVRVRVGAQNAMRDWTLRADNQNHHHGVVRLSESPLTLALSWKRTIADKSQAVGTFRLDLPGLLAGGYLRREGGSEDAVRLRIVRTDEGSFWIECRNGAPRLRIPDARGSKLWIREAVNKESRLLNERVKAAIGLSMGDEITWRSPLCADGFRECGDNEALERVGALPLRVPLEQFWPSGGPMWDALGTTTNDKKLFVEAKAHIRELVSPPSKASDASLGRIQKALQEARAFIAPLSVVDWSSTFYQYANRLAFLYFLRQQNGIDAHLILVGFTGDHDMRGPISSEAWDAAYIILNAALGIPEEHPLTRFVHHVTLDVAELNP